MPHSPFSEALPQDARSLVEQLPVGIGVYDASTLALQQANPAFLRLLDPLLEERWQGGHILGVPLAQWIPLCLRHWLAQLPVVQALGISSCTSAQPFPLPGDEILSWNCTAQLLSQGNGASPSLLQTITAISSPPGQRKETTQAGQPSAEQLERQRLTIVERLARTISSSLSLRQISALAIDLLSTHCSLQAICLHCVQTTQPLLYLLASRFTMGGSILSQAKYRTMPVPALCSQHEPLLIDDLSSDTATPETPLTQFGGRGYLCLPLWSTDRCEGLLSVLFAEPLTSREQELLTLLCCGPHLAAAFAHARVYASLQEQQLFLSEGLRHLPEGVLLIEAFGGTIRYANQAASTILGIPQQALLGEALKPALPLTLERGGKGQLLVPWMFLVVEALSGQTVMGQEVQFTRPDGSVVVALGSCAPLRNQDKLISAAVLLLQDITEYKSLEQQKDDFLSCASHELRTPLTALLGYSELIEQVLLTEGPAAGAQSVIRAATRLREQSMQMARLINDLLTISQLTYDQFPLELAPCDLQEVLQEAIEEWQGRATRHHCVLNIEGPTQTATWTGTLDRSRIKQVIGNLLENAVKYSPIGTTIELGMRRWDQGAGAVLLWVKDQGQGIPAQDQPHLFRRFYRSAHQDRGIGGLGIGLYIVKELVTRHRGSVWVESRLGQYTTFFVKLPLQLPASS